MKLLLLFVVSFSTFSATLSKFERVERDLLIYDKAIEKKKAEFSKIIKNENDKDWIVQKLDHMVKVDQYMRDYFHTPTKKSYSKAEEKFFQEKFMPRFRSIDSGNTQDLKKLIKKYGWFKISEFGEKADKQAWLLVQHADMDLDFQKEVLKTLSKLYLSGETNKSNYAYLYDRVASIGEQRPQKYGTQGKCVGAGVWEPDEIEDVENVDKYRKSMGMVSMAEYKSWFKDICK